MFESLNSIAPHARSGTVRALAVTGDRRSPGFPDLPTVAEAGVPGYAAPTWSGVIGPAGIPRPILETLNAAINRAIKTPAFQERFAMIGVDAAQEIAQRRAAPFSDCAPAFHANQPRDLRLLRQCVELVERPGLLVFDQAIEGELVAVLIDLRCFAFVVIGVEAERPRDRA